MTKRGSHGEVKPPGRSDRQLRDRRLERHQPRCVSGESTELLSRYSRLRMNCSEPLEPPEKLIAFDVAHCLLVGIISMAQTAAGRMYMGARKLPVSSQASGVRNQ